MGSSAGVTLRIMLSASASDASTLAPCIPRILCECIRQQYPPKDLIKKSCLLTTADDAHMQYSGQPEEAMEPLISCLDHTSSICVPGKNQS